MTGIPGIMIRMYGLLLRLYPNSFRSEFAEQMLLDFSDMAADAGKKGCFSFALFCLHELIDFPVNLLRVHFEEGRMFRLLRSQPVNYSLRGAFGFGLAFGLAILVDSFLSLKLWIEDDSMIGLLQVYVYGLFHTEHGLELISWIPYALGSLVTGLFLGIVVAFLFADRSKYARYILVTMLCWFLHDAVESILMNSVGLGFFLGDRHMIYFMRALSILSGASLGLICYVAKSGKRSSSRMLIMSAFGYPAIAYLYLQLIFKLSLVETPWMFIALMLLMIVYIGGIILIAVKSESSPKVPWLVVVGLIGYPLLPYAGHYFAYLLSLLIHSPYPRQMPVGSPDYWRLMVAVALEQSIYGILFGMLIGLVFGLQKKSSPPQLTANH